MTRTVWQNPAVDETFPTEAAAVDDFRRIYPDAYTYLVVVGGNDLVGPFRVRMAFATRDESFDKLKCKALIITVDEESTGANAPTP